MSNKTEASTQNYVSEFYEERRYQKTYSRCYHDWWNQKMLSLVSVAGRILDNGCGTGILFEYLLKGKAAFGMDISPNMLKFAQQRWEKLILGDSQELPFKDGSFDLIVGRSLLHHLPKPRRGVAEMARVLRDEGEVVVADTNRSILSSIPRAIAKKGEHFSDDHQNLHRAQLVALLEEFFIIDHICHFGYFAYPLGFPDLIDLGKFLPYPVAVTKTLIKVDEWISKIPLIRTQSWGIIIKGTKKGSNHG